MTSPDAGHSAGQLETRGIEPVPEHECNGNPLQLFWVWFAANISILGLPLGATLVAFHQLAIWQVVIVALIGAGGSFALVGVISIAGRRGRAPSLTLSRAVFGVRGNIGPTLVSLISRVGWETVNTTTAAFVLLALSSILFNTPTEAKSAPLLTLVFIAIFTLLTLAVSGLGHATLLLIQKWATYVFGALNLLVGGFCAPPSTGQASSTPARRPSAPSLSGSASWPRAPVSVGPTPGLTCRAIKKPASAPPNWWPAPPGARGFRWSC